MRVLIIRPFPEKLSLDSYNVQEIGLAGALRRSGVECDIVFFNGTQESKKQLLDNGITVFWLSGINILKNGLFRGLRKLVKEYDIIQVHEYDQLQSWIIYTFYKKPVVIYHGPYYDSFNKGYNLKCKLFDTFFLPFSKKAKNRIHCLTKSPFATEFLRNKGFLNVKTAGVGLNTNSFNKDKNDKEGRLCLSDKLFNAAYVGKIEERRNISFLMDLAEMLKKAMNDFCLTVVGRFDGAEYKKKIGDRFFELVDKGVIHYIESASQIELAALYSTADVFLFTTNYDIFGMVLLEAMYYGAVPVSSINGGSATLVENAHDGYVIDNYEVDEWAKVIIRLHDEPDILENLKRNAHKKIEDHFTWDALAKEFIDTYKESIAEGNNGRRFVN